MTPRLTCFAQSGNAYKVALALDLLGQPWEPVFVDFFKGETRTPDYRTTNEMAEVPSYIEGDLHLTQSGVILDHLAERHGRFGPETPAERREIWRWILWDNHKLTANLATGRFMMNFLPEAKRKPDVIAFLIGRARAAMDVLDRRLEGRDFILGARPTIADLSAIGYFFYLDEAGIDIGDWSALPAWRDRIAAMPGWRHPYEAMPGHPREAS